MDALPSLNPEQVESFKEEAEEEALKSGARAGTAVSPGMPTGALQEGFFGKDLKRRTRKAA